MKKTKTSVKTLFFLNIVVLVGILLTTQAILNALHIKNGMEAQVMETLKARTGEIANRMNQRILQVEQKTAGLAMSVSNMPTYDTNVMFGMADGYIKSDSLVIGSGFWFEPNAYAPGVPFYGPYRHRGDDDVIRLTMIYNNEEYDYDSTEWYLNAIKHPDTVAWTGPYIDDVTSITMLTSACTIRKNEQIAGCVTIDIGITELEEYIREIRIGQNGYAFLVSKDGFYLAMSDETKNMNLKITEEQDPVLADLGQKILAADELTLIDAEHNGNDIYVMVSPLCIDNIKLVLIAPKSDYTGGIRQSIVLSVFMMILIMLLLCVAIHTVFKLRIGQPISQLVDAAEKIANGEQAELQLSSEDEMGHLAHSLQDMAEKLQLRSTMLENQYRLLSAKTRQLEVALQNVESMRAARDNYKIESETDKLTGLLNKAATERLAKEYLANLKENKLAALFILDLDHFKEANDTHGHRYGDDILQTFAAELRSGFRPSDIVGRFGGDEFVVLISDLPDRSIVERKAVHILNSALGVKADGQNAGISVSVGIAIAPWQGTTYEDLFQAADRALYKVKEQGRNGYSICSEETVHGKL